MTTASERAPITPMLLAFSAILVPLIAAFVVARVPVSSTTLITGGLLLTLVGLLHVRLTVYLIISACCCRPSWGSAPPRATGR